MRRIELIIQEPSYVADRRQTEINLALSNVHEFPNLEADTFQVEVGFIHDIQVTMDSLDHSIKNKT